MRTPREWILRVAGAPRHGRRDDDLAEEVRRHMGLGAELPRRMRLGIALVPEQVRASRLDPIVVLRAE